MGFWLLHVLSGRNYKVLENLIVTIFDFRKYSYKDSRILRYYTTVNQANTKKRTEDSSQLRRGVSWDVLLPLVDTNHCVRQGCRLQPKYHKLTKHYQPIVSLTYSLTLISTWGCMKREFGATDEFSRFCDTTSTLSIACEHGIGHSDMESQNNHFHNSEGHVWVQAGTFNNFAGFVQSDKLRAEDEKKSELLRSW